jgi:hypothetical protein
MVPVPLYDATPALIFSSLFPTSSHKPHYTRNIHIHYNNQENSRLLHLPPEIRSLIWQALLCQTTIHVVWAKSNRLKRCTHCAVIPNPIAPNAVCPYISIPLSSRLPQFQQPKFDPSPAKGKKSTPRSLANGILLVSRQIRSEVSSLILPTVPITIDSPYAFYSFFRHLPGSQRAQLRSLRLVLCKPDIEYDHGNPSQLCWNRVLHPSLLRQLTGLKELGIAILAEAGNTPVYFGKEVLDPQLSRGLLRFRELPLTDVDVILKYSQNWIWRRDERVRNIERLVTCAGVEDLRKKILRQKELDKREVMEREEFLGRPSTKTARWGRGRGKEGCVPGWRW